MEEVVEFLSGDDKEVYASVNVGNDELVGIITSERSVMVPGWIMGHQGLSDRSVRLWGYLKGALTGALTVPGTTHRSLAMLLDVSERTAREAIYELRDVGALTVEPRFVNGRQMGNRYLLWPMQGVATSSQGGDTLPPVYKNIITNNSINNTTQIEAPAKRSKAEYDADFEALWEMYPRRINKLNSYKAFQRTIRRGASLDDLITAVRNYAEACEGKEERYIMHGATFFGSGERWRDFVEAGGSASVDYGMTDEEVKSAVIFDDYDQTGVWYNVLEDGESESCLDNPGKFGYTRPRNKQNQLVDASGTPYELDAQGKRHGIGYWNERS